MPRLSDDDVLDFQIMEAVAARMVAEQNIEQKRREREAWKRQPVGSGPPPGG